MSIRRLNSVSANFSADLNDLLSWESVSDPSVAQTVATIIGDVRSNGDAAVIEYTNRFDRRDLTSIDELKISSDELARALARIPAVQLEALNVAAKRVQDYHEHQRQESWQFSESDGTVLGQKITPMDRVGLYVPGGKASYPSSVLMNAIPAKVAGVGHVVMVVPAPNNELSDLVLAAAAIAGVDEIYTMGGAQAVAALAYGTSTIKKVDKIVGPGNI